MDVDLAPGESKTLTFDLEPLVTLTGRVLDHPSGTPVANLRMFASRDNSFNVFSRNESKTDADGRFTITNAPTGTITISGYGGGDDFDLVEVVRTITGPSSVDVGTLRRVKRSWKIGDAVGLGFEVKAIAPDTPADQRLLVVSTIDPQGPAAKTELRIGDVITAIDDLDVRGGNSPLFSTMAPGARGTTARIGLSRGVTIQLQR